MRLNKHNRRDFLRTAGIMTAAMAVPALAAKKDKKPNILMILADDQNWLDCGCYGNRDVKTPNIDRLASEGMKFNLCFTATAMCAPTRQQLYTGIFPVRNGAYPNHSKVKPGTKSMVHHLRDLGCRVALCGKTHFGPRESFPFDFVQKNALEKYITKDKDQPYCLAYTSHSPHCPWSAGDASKYDPDKITIPKFMIDTPETRKALCRYYAEVTSFDQEVGFCMEAVEKGDKNNTIFIYTSEQGMQLPFAKWTCYDMGLHTGLVIRWPEKVRAGSTTDAMVQYVDMVPTLIDAAGGEKRDDLDGSSFLQVLLGKKDEFNEYVYGVHTNKGIIVGTPYPVRSIRTKKYKYIMNLNHEGEYRNVMIAQDKEKFVHSWFEKAKTDAAAKKRVDQYLKRPAEELYDVEKDPFELENLSADPKNRKVMDQLKEKLQAWMKQQGDKGMETELAGKKKKEGGKKKKKKK